MTIEELNAITAQFGELFKQYVSNPIFRQNLDLLMKVPIQQMNLQHTLEIMALVKNKYHYELKGSSEPWRPNILDRDESLNVINTPPPSIRVSAGLATESAL